MADAKSCGGSVTKVCFSDNFFSRCDSFSLKNGAVLSNSHSIRS